MTFKDLSLRPEIHQALSDLGFTNPTEIQSKAIPALLTQEFVDFHGQAQTGTGKTLAFGIPLVEHVKVEKKVTQALIVAPTRELVLQIADSIKSVAKGLPLSVVPIYGGAPMYEQTSALRKGAHIVVGTPGRLNDHLRRGTLKLDNVKTLVLDEADIMLDMGFKEEMEEILSHIPQQRQIWLFSATVKQGISDIMRTHMKNTVSVRVAKQDTGAPKTKQYFATVSQKDRLRALIRFIDAVPSFYGFVFCQTKLLAAQISQELVKAGYKANALHGDMSQAQRNHVIAEFKSKTFTILICTDVAARGIDVSDCTHVMNFSLPEDQESYVHRVGRTGRAGKEGTAISFISSWQTRFIKTLERKFNVEIKPINVPTFEEIAHIKVVQANDHLKQMIESKTEQNYYTHKLSEFINAFTTDELKKAVVQLLNEKFCKEMKVEDDKSFANAASRQVRENVSDEARSEVTIFMGTDDGLTQEELDQFLKECKSVDISDMARVRVIRKRSFIKISPEQGNKLVNEIKGQMLAGMRIRAAVTVDEDRGFESGRRENRGGGRSGGSSRGRSSGRRR